MATKRGNLIRFLRENLERGTYKNLHWVEEKDDIFYLHFPRFDKKKSLTEYEKILIDYYEMKGTISKYPGFSNARGVLISALNNSAYLIPTPCKNKKLCFRFTTPVESHERKRIKRMKGKLNIQDPLLEDPNLYPPSPECLLHSPSAISTRSPDQGYLSMEEDQHDFPDPNIHEDPDVNNLISMCLDSPEDCIKNAFTEIMLDSDESLENIDMEDLVPLIGNELAKENEIANPSISLETYWLCTTKFHIDSTSLVFICEKQQIIQDQNEGISAGQIVIPSNIWEDCNIIQS